MHKRVKIPGKYGNFYIVGVAEAGVYVSRLKNGLISGEVTFCRRGSFTLAE